MSPYASPLTPHALNWDDIDDVLLDMDGTLLDRHFDNVLFEEALPRRYAEQQALSFDQARDSLMAMYRSVEGRLEWTDLAYWTNRVGIDVVALHRELNSLIDFLPDAREFLSRLRKSGKRITVLTNAHRAGVEIKAAKTGLDRYVDRIVDAFQVGFLKMHEDYWPHCQELVGFDPTRSLYIDDDEKCLAAAEKYGVGRVFHRSKSSSQLPPAPSAQFTSIEDFSPLMTGL
jgi:HAD superfamily hydrolase (TIGR01509 family)